MELFSPVWCHSLSQLLSLPRFPLQKELQCFFLQWRLDYSLIQGHLSHMIDCVYVASNAQSIVFTSVFSNISFTADTSIRSSDCRVMWLFPDWILFLSSPLPILAPSFPVNLLRDSLIRSLLDSCIICCCLLISSMMFFLTFRRNHCLAPALVLRNRQPPY